MNLDKKESLQSHLLDIIINKLLSKMKMKLFNSTFYTFLCFVKIKMTQLMIFLMMVN